MHVQGWHKIHIGYWSTMLKGEEPPEMVLKLKLTGDASWPAHFTETSRRSGRTSLSRQDVAPGTILAS